jgi:hypothetical protein
VLVLAVGLVSILAVFPVALNWGGVAMASSTGSVAARTCFAYVQENHAVLPSDGYINVPSSDEGNLHSDLLDGGYHVKYNIGGSGSTRTVVIRVFRNDLSRIPERQRAKALEEVLCQFEGIIFTP